MNVPRKYHLLRFIAFVLKLIAWLVLLLGIAGTVVAVLAWAGPSANWPSGFQALRPAVAIVAPLAAIVWFVQLFAFGSILSLLVDIEENTRTLAARTAAGEASLPPA